MGIFCVPAIPWCVNSNTTESDTGAIIDKTGPSDPGAAKDEGSASGIHIFSRSFT